MSGHDINQTLERIGTVLAQRFDGTISADLVVAYVNDSYVALHRTAHTNQQLPGLAQRFAVDRLTALAQATAAVGKPVPEVLFLCIHNAGRSQMGAALMAHHAQGRVNVRSAGSQPSAAVSGSAATVLGELGINLGSAYPKPLTAEVLRAADVVVIMGGGDACPRLSGPRYDVWDLPNLTGGDLDATRTIRDDIDARVQRLLTELTS